MSEITISLLTLIGLLGSANALLWVREKVNNGSRQDLKANSLKTPKTSILQNNEIQSIQEQLMQLNEYIGKSNGFLTEIKKLKNQQESIYSRINALEEATIQIQNKLNEVKPLKSIKPLSLKKGKTPKSDRVKILEGYLKKI